MADDVTKTGGLPVEGGLRALLEGPARDALERQALPRLVAGQRWFAGKGQAIETARVIDDAVLEGRAADEEFLLPQIAVDLGGGGRQSYFLPVALGAIPAADTLANLRGPGGETVPAGDAGHVPDFVLAVLDALESGCNLATSRGGTVRFSPTSTFTGAGEAAACDVRRLSGEQSNTSIAIGTTLVLKLYRRLQTGLTRRSRWVAS